jgi:carboxymethylenebutenolidase
MDRRKFCITACGTGLAMSLPRLSGRADAQVLPETVRFPSLDGTTLVGYLFTPSALRPVPSPAVILLHGRAGAYSSLAKGRHDASTLTQRHLLWSRYWVERGAFALLVDSFGPRGFPAGFAAGTHDDRPPQLNEVTVRPLDAYGALKYLASRKDLDAGRIGLQGWSNGGSAVLATMAVATLRAANLPASSGFRAALAFYPGCGLENRFRDGYEAYAPVRILIGTADEEVSPERCQQLVAGTRRAGIDVALTMYPNATHDFDDPGQRRQSVAANVAAATAAMGQASAFLGGYLRL